MGHQRDVAPQRQALENRQRVERTQPTRKAPPEEITGDTKTSGALLKNRCGARIKYSKADRRSDARSNRRRPRRFWCKISLTIQDIVEGGSSILLRLWSKFYLHQNRLPAVLPIQGQG